MPRIANQAIAEGAAAPTGRDSAQDNARAARPERRTGIVRREFSIWRGGAAPCGVLPDRQARPGPGKTGLGEAGAAPS
jgi:hypothetical protein